MPSRCNQIKASVESPQQIGGLVGILDGEKCVGMVEKCVQLPFVWQGQKETLDRDISAEVEPVTTLGVCVGKKTVPRSTLACVCVCVLLT